MVVDPLALALDVIASLQLRALLVRFRDPDEEGARAAVEVAADAQHIPEVLLVSLVEGAVQQHARLDREDDAGEGELAGHARRAAYRSARLAVSVCDGFRREAQPKPRVAPRWLLVQQGR